MMEGKARKKERGWKEDAREKTRCEEEKGTFRGRHGEGR
jgi:hypothetical protein